jgi:hypothetical protein
MNTQERPPFEKRGDKYALRIRLPYALEPGEYQVNWNFQNEGNGNRSFLVNGPDPVVVQLRGEGDPQAAAPVEDKAAPAKVPASRPAGKR